MNALLQTSSDKEVDELPTGKTTPGKKPRIPSCRLPSLGKRWVHYCGACSGQEVAALLAVPIRKPMNSLTVKPPAARKSKVSLLLSLLRDGSRWAASDKVPGPQFAQTITKSFTEPSRNLHGLQQSFFDDYFPSSPPLEWIPFNTEEASSGKEIDEFLTVEPPPGF